MKKTIGLLCGLTIISSCSYIESGRWQFWKDTNPNNQVEGERRDPMHNAGNSTAPVTGTPPANLMPQAGNPQIHRAEPIAGNPRMITPPLPGTEIPTSDNSTPDTTITLMSMEVVQNPDDPASGASETQLVAQVSDDDLNKPADSSAATSNETNDPNISAKSAALPPLPSANSPEPTGEAAKDEFPKLSEVPPTPPAPKPMASQVRVKQMKEDLTSMQQQRAASESGQPVVMKSEPPTPPAGTVPPAQPMVMSAANNASAMQENPGLLPEGPTIVVHSQKGASRAPVTEATQVAMPAKPAPANAASLPPIPPSFAAASRPQTLGTAQAPAMQPLHVAAKEPMGAASDYPQDMNQAAMAPANETGLSGLSPTPSSGGHHYRLLPESRYAKLHSLK